MRTSATQFETMINFMEKHGDINKPQKEAHGRMQTIKRWERLREMLNSDPTGDTKSVDKWKKVWSDLKNNTKKKASKINKSVRGTGGGPALSIKLSEIEQKVLRIIGIQAVTGIPGIREAGLALHSQAPINDKDSNRTETLTFSPTDNESPSIIAFINSIGNETWMQAGTSLQSHVPAPALSPAPAPAQTPPSSPAPAPTPPRASTPAQSHHAPAPWCPLERPAHRSTVEQPALRSPVQSPVPLSPLERPVLRSPLESPAHRGTTPRQRRRETDRRNVGTPRRRRVRRPQSHIDETAQHFLRSDEDWRDFQKQKHLDETEVAKEKLRVRRLELEVQKKWQEITVHAIDTLNKILEAKL